MPAAQQDDMTHQGDRLPYSSVPFAILYHNELAAVLCFQTGQFAVACHVP